MSPLAWREITRADGVHISQGRARNNSWYLIVPEATGSFALRYASQAGNYPLASGLSLDAAKAEAEAHADRYSNREP